MENRKLFWLVVILAGLVSFFLVTRSFAQGSWWNHRAQIYVSSTTVEAAFSNNTSVPIYCEGIVYGKTYHGTLLRNSSSGIVAPNGGVGGIFVYTNINDPFVNGWANIQCTTNY